MNMREFKETLKICTDKELFDCFDRYKEKYGRWDKRTSAIVCELEDRGWEVEPIVTAEDYKEWAAASCGMNYVGY